jgi:hypothetical protein
MGAAVYHLRERISNDLDDSDDDADCDAADQRMPN